MRTNWMMMSHFYAFHFMIMAINCMNYSIKWKAALTIRWIISQPTPRKDANQNSLSFSCGFFSLKFWFFFHCQKTFRTFRIVFQRLQNNLNVWEKIYWIDFNDWKWARDTALQFIWYTHTQHDTTDLWTFGIALHCFGCLEFRK